MGNRKAKVIFDYQIFAAQQYGGISRYFVELARQFSAGCPSLDYEIIAPLYRNRYLRDSPELNISGLYLPEVPYLGRATLKMNALISVPKWKYSGASLLHQSYYWEGSRARKHWKGPIFLTVYDMIHERFPQYFSGKDLTSRRKAESVRNADHVFCISEQTKKDLIEILNVEEKKITVTYLAHSLSFESEKPSISVFDREAPFLLYVGPRSGYKNFHSLLDIYLENHRLQNEFSLLCLGGGAFTPSELERIAKIPDGEKKIRQINGDDRALVQLYQRARAFIYPSLYEGFGIPPLEAMALGCPVVCGKGGSLEEVVGNAAALCEPDSKESLNYAIESVAFNEEIRNKCIERGKSRAKLFSWQRCANETYSVYKRFL